MFRTLAPLFAALVLGAAPGARAQVSDTARAPVQVMIVGTFHLANPGQDMHNMTVDPVTTPAKQAELEAVAAALSRFRPTAVAIERVASDPVTLLDARYGAFTPADLLEDADERVQIGYRLARREGLERVYAIDEQPGAGERDYFPIDKVMDWAAAHDQQARLQVLNGPVAAMVEDLQARQRRESLGALLADFNRLDHPVNGTLNLYYGLLAFGDAVDQPGAELNAAWYERNAKIFAKLMRTVQPGDRIVVVYGAGHAYWLRHFIENTPGFELVEATPYLAGL